MSTVIEQDGVTITLKRRSYGEKLDSMATVTQHIKPTAAQTPLERARMIGCENFIFCMSFVQKIEGADLIKPTAEMSPEEFEAAYQRFTAQDDLLIERWLRACNTLAQPATAPEHAPPKAVEDQEAADPS